MKDFGLIPRSFQGLVGLLSHPLLHADWSHLIHNSITAIVLLTVLFWFYRQVAWRVVFYSWLITGLWMWLAAREGNHIGFSGVIYALAAFIFLSGLLKKYFRLMALSGIIIFLYGSMIWGILPIDPTISWEGHLFGAMSGFLLAWYFRDRGPKRPQYSWEIDGDENVDHIPWREELQNQQESEDFSDRKVYRIHYQYKRKK